MKKSLLLIVALLANLSAWSQQLSVTQYKAKCTKFSTLYVGEIVDGQQSFHYLYSDNLTNSEKVFEAVKQCLSDFNEGNYGALVPDIVGETENIGIAVCSNTDFEAMMGPEWLSAEKAGEECLSGATIISSSSDSLFKTNVDFAKKCREFYQTNYHSATMTDSTGRTVGVSGIYGELSMEKHSVQLSGENSTTLSVTNISYTCELVTVIYTKAEFESTFTGVVDINASDRKRGQRYNLIGQPVGSDYKGFVIEDGKKVIVR